MQQPVLNRLISVIIAMSIALVSYTFFFSEAPHADQSPPPPKPKIKKIYPQKESTASEAVEDEVVIRIKRSSSFQNKDSLEQTGLRLAKSLTGSFLNSDKPVVISALYPSLNMLRLRLPKGISTQAAIEFMSKDSEVSSVSLDYKGTLHGHNFSPPNDYYWTNDWPASHPLSSMAYLWGLDKIGMKRAWQYFPQWGTLSVNTPIVAIIDTGIDYNHPELSANRWSNSDECCWSPTGIPMPNGIDDDHNGYVDDFFGVNIVYEHSTALGLSNDCSVSPQKTPLDDDGHGTSVAGTIAAKGNNNNSMAQSYTVGITQAVRLMSVKITCLHGSDQSEKPRLTDATLGIEYAIRMGAQVIVGAWGFTVLRNNYNSSTIDDLRMAIQRGEQSTLYAASAGNRDLDIDRCNTPLWPQKFGLPNVIVTAASTPSDVRWVTQGHGSGSPPCSPSGFFGSNYGDTSVDIAAPGADDPAVIMTVAANGDSSEVASYGGTSAAVPHVAGCAAILQASYSMAHQNTFMSPIDLKMHLLTSGDPSALPIKRFEGYARRLNCGTAVSTLPSYAPAVPKNLTVR